MSIVTPWRCVARAFDTGDHEPGLSALDGCLEILGDTTVAIEPGNGLLDHPPAPQELEALGSIGSLDDFHSPAAEFGKRMRRLGAGIAGISKDVTQPSERTADAGEQRRCAIAVLDVCRVHDGTDEKADRVGHDVLLAALDLVAGDRGEVR